MPKQIGSIDLKTTGYLYGQISSLESQVDGQIQTWAQSTNPATWSSSDNGKHLGDLWLYTGTSDIEEEEFTFHPQGIYRYVYVEENNTYKWEAYSSTNNNIFDLTDSKKRVFYGADTPTPPYDLKDLWVQGSNGDIKVCTTARTSGSGNTSDWALASKYTDNSALTAFENGTYATFVTDTNTALGNKITTFYVDGPTGPTASTTGDLWIDTNDNNKLYRWNGSSWVLVRDAGIQTALTNAANAKTIADSKIITFAEPSPPTASDEGDLWIDTDANNKMYRWSGAEWVPYTDTSSLQYWIANTYTPEMDSKIETFYQSSNPSSNWATNTEKEKHIGDLWYYTGQTTTTAPILKQDATYRWSKTGTNPDTYDWQQQNVPTEVFDQIGEKKKIFYGSSVPTPPYALHDLWVQGSDGDIKICTNARNSGSGVASDWVLASNYIDSADATTIANNSADARKTTESKTQYAVSSSNISAPDIDSNLWQDNMPSVSSITSGNYLWTRECNKINGSWVYPTNPTGYLANTFNGLSLFTNSVANDGYTSINGSTVTTGKIQDSSGKNFIQLSTENNVPAGQVEFKDASTWENSIQGLQWDSTNGELNIKGNIRANQLTIVGADGTSYNGTAAINISGYSIEIEKNSTDYESGVSVYLYPILYHNGVKLDEYVISSDVEVNSSKTYYEKISDVYEEIQDPDPSSNPHELEWYEKQIDYTHFIWYEDDNNIGTAGDSDRGKILAIYGHIYKVTYDFDDGAVEPGTEIQERLVDPSKYITKTSDTEIRIHPEEWENQSSYIQLDTDGLNLFNSNNNSIAQYGSTARVGLDNSSRFLMNTNSLEAYDSSNNKYFEVSSTGIKYGNNISVASQTDVNNAAATATNYITTIDNGGITIHSNDDNNEQNILMNTDGFSIRNGLLPMMTLDNDSLDFNLIDTTAGTYVNLAAFGGSTRIGQEEVGYAKVLLSPSVFNFLSSESTSVFKTGVVSEETATSRIEVSTDWNAQTTTGLQLGTYVLAPNASTTVSGVFYSSVVANLDAGIRFSLKIGIYKNDLTYTYIIFNEPAYVAGEGFTTGEAKTITGSYLRQPNVSVYYDGVATFTISGTITNSSIVSWNFSRDKAVFTGQTEPIETKIYNTFIGGNAFVNSSNGAIYIGMSQKSEIRSSDYDLYNAITALGWEDDVMVGITLAEHTKTIDSSSMLVDNTIGISAIPLNATITITSSDTAVISGGSVEFVSEDLYFVELDIVSTGTTTITASTIVGDEMYSDSCDVTVV